MSKIFSAKGDGGGEKAVELLGLCNYISIYSGYDSSSLGFISSKTARNGDEEGESVLIYD